MKEEMRQAEQLTRLFRHQRIHRLISIEEARPRYFRRSVRQRRLALAAVESVVTVPERLPGSKIAPFNRPYQQRVVQCLLLVKEKALRIPAANSSFGKLRYRISITSDAAAAAASARSISFCATP